MALSKLKVETDASDQALLDNLEKGTFVLPQTMLVKDCSINLNEAEKRAIEE